MFVTKSKFLSALQGKGQGAPPVWFMRQAGRYLPEYQEIRQKYPLRELFLNPELAAQITCLPVDSLGVDAAILFSDIMVIGLALGLELDFQEGPVLRPLISPQNVASCVFDLEPLLPVQKTIELLRPALRVPLIGFAGAPFTVATYLIEQKHNESCFSTKKWMYQDPASFAQLLEKIEQATLAYLTMQIDAGVQAVQIFDSWAQVLSFEQFKMYCLPFYLKVIETVKKQRNIPVILFMRGISSYLSQLTQLDVALSLDWQTSLFSVRQQSSQTLQGNLDPDLLFAPISTIQRATKTLLKSMENDSGFILNLGHGIKPKTPVEAVRCIVDIVQNH